MLREMLRRSGERKVSVESVRMFLELECQAFEIRVRIRVQDRITGASRMIVSCRYEIRNYCYC